MTDNAKFRWQGSTYACRIIGEGTEGRTRVEALEHGPRFAVGTELEVTAQEIILPFDTSIPPIPHNDPDALQKAMNEERTTLPPPAALLDSVEGRSLAPLPVDALQAAMDAERETLPTVAEVLANPNPTPPLSASSQAAAPQTGDKMTEIMGTPFAEKMKSVATGATDIMTKMIARADAFNAKKQELEARTDAVFAKHEKVLADGHAGLDMVEDGLRLLSNGGPA